MHDKRSRHHGLDSGSYEPLATFEVAKKPSPEPETGSRRQAAAELLLPDGPARESIVVRGEGQTEINPTSDGAETSMLLQSHRAGSKTDGNGFSNHGLRETMTKWGIFWLRRRVLGVFTAVYLSFAIAVSSLTAYSSTHDGIAEPESDSYPQYVWKFTPTAFLVIVAALWSRVELQALKYTPWIQLSKCTEKSHASCHCESLLSLDYTHIFSPAAFLKAIKMRHWLPAISLLVSFIIRISIVLSTSLLTLETLGLDVEVPIQVLDSFAEPNFLSSEGNYSSEAAEEFVDYRSFYTPMAVLDLNVSYPFGLTQDIAFQTFEVMQGPSFDYPFVIGAVTVQAIVEGLKIELECEQSPTCAGPLATETRLDEHEIEFPSCDETLKGMRVIAPVFPPPSRPETFIQWRYESWDESNKDSTLDLSLQKCTSLPHQSRYFLLWTAVVGADPQPKAPFEDPDGPEDVPDARPVLGCSAVLCAPKLTLSPVRITHRGPDVTVENLDPSLDRPLNADIEPIMRMALDPLIPVDYRGAWSPGAEGPFDVQGNPTSDPAPLHAWKMAFDTAKSSNVTLGWLENEELELQIKSLFGQLGPAVAHYSLRKSNGTATTGTVSYQVGRLIVTAQVGIAMAILTGLAAAMVLCLLCFCVPAAGIGNRDPGVILGVATLLRVQNDENDTGHAVAENNSESCFLKLYPTPSKSACTGHQTFRLLPIPQHIREGPLSSDTPWIIQPRFLGVVVVGVLGLIAALAILLSVGGSSQGIAMVDIENNPYLYLLWTTLPASVLLAVSLHTAACNGLFRSLAVVSHLSRPSPSTTLEVSWVDMFGLQVMWRSMRDGRYQMSFYELLTIAANFLTILSTLIFNADSAVKVETVNTQPTTWFGVKEAQISAVEFDLGLRLASLFTADRNTDAGSLIFPRSTYQNFALPSFESLPLSDTVPPDTTVAVDTEAVHLSSHCYPVPSTEYTFESYPHGPTNDTDDTAPSDAGYVIQTTVTCPSGKTVDYEDDIRLSSPPNGTIDESGRIANQIYFAHALSSPVDFDQDFHPCYFGEGRKPDPLKQRSSRRWIWGYSSNYSSNGIEFHSYWHCDYTWEVVDARVRLSARDLSIDSRSFPEFNMSTSRRLDPPIPFPAIEEGRGYLEVNGTTIVVFPDPTEMNSTHENEPMDFDSGFRALLKPYRGMELADFANETRQEDIMEALDSNFRYIAAQYASIFNRLDISEKSTLPPFGAPTLAPVQATLETRGSKLYQNVVPTCLVIGILVLVLVANVRGLLITTWRRRRPGRSRWLEGSEYPSFVPKGINSIATPVQLWAESNVFQWLPPDADRISVEGLHQLLRGTRFKLGWFRRKGDGARVFTIGILDPEHWSEVEDK